MRYSILTTVLLDTTAQHSNASREVLEILRTAVDQDGQTVVIGTHDARAASYADRVIFLRDGNIVDETRDSDMDSILCVMAGMED